MNVYDFDGTIYRGDSSIDLYKYSIKRFPWIIVFLPWQAFFFFFYKIRFCSKECAKSAFFSFIRWIPDMSTHLEKFWDTYQNRIEHWYTAQQKEDDVIISASPEFLLSPICKRLKINNLIASQVERKGGRFISKNCYAEEKCRRFRQQFNDSKIDAFYSDSLSDLPMMRMAQQSYLVDKSGPHLYQA